MCFNTAEEHYKSNPKPRPFQVLMLPVNLSPQHFHPAEKKLQALGSQKGGQRRKRVKS